MPIPLIQVGGVFVPDPDEMFSVRGSGSARVRIPFRVRLRAHAHVSGHYGHQTHGHKTHSR